jgi:hypothetical protein
MENVHEEDQDQDAATDWDRCYTEIWNKLRSGSGNIENDGASLLLKDRHSWVTRLHKTKILHNTDTLK